MKQPAAFRGTMRPPVPGLAVLQLATPIDRRRPMMLNATRRKFLASAVLAGKYVVERALEKYVRLIKGYVKQLNSVLTT